ncbi:MULTISPECIES: thiolase family protein [unclassified Phenylobacterium]|uniref:thiolase family protein n=1 Tax=unclassified Phenylobacterium TaxID=2640670 RepID=UPI001A198666|nr:MULTISPECIES: thiolase family protein [unclassified Phenylobacterium]MBJ7411299.1 thiolase family protein [Phenylobacterium sp.]MCR5879861.1 thiolase family protein [Phenylobacterium sp. J367]
MLDATIVGLGLEGITREPTASARVLAARAVLAAAADAGLPCESIDGLLVCRSGGATEADLGLELQRTLSLRDLRLLQVSYAEGASAIANIQLAAMAVSHGMASAVACVFADAPLTPGRTGRQAFAQRKAAAGLDSLRYAAGLFGGAGLFSLPTRRYIDRYGASPEDFGAVAVTTRGWAGLNPLATFRQPLTMEQYLASKFIAEPLRLYDCAAPVNGAVAVIVTRSDRAAHLARPPIHILGMGQGHPGELDQAGGDRGLHSGAAAARATAFRMAGVDLSDIDFCQFYDAFTLLTLTALEAYGFCDPGEAGAFIRSGATAPGGALPVNTGGGHLSGFYLQGMTPVAEAVIQLRGDAGERSCPRRDIGLVTNEGGQLDHHANLVLSRQRRAA